MADWKARNEVADSDDEDDELEALARPATGEDEARNPATDGKQRDGYHASNRLEEPTSQLVQPSSPPWVAKNESEDEQESEDELALPAPWVANSQQLAHVPLDKLFSESNNQALSAQISSTAAPDIEVENERQDYLGTQVEPQLQSSPLSSLSTTPRAQTPFFLDTESQRTHSQSFQLLGVEQHSPRDLSEDLLENDGAYAPARSLRRRNAIQLNPYRVEDAIYRQFSKRAGLAPIRLNRQHTSSMEDTQDYVPPALHGRGAGGHVNHSGSGLDSSQPVLDSDREITSVFELPSSPGTHLKWSGDRHRKRRRLDHVRGNTIEDTAHVGEDHVRTDPDREALLEHLPSPSSSSDQIQEAALSSKRAFRYPPGITPPQLQTPLASSETRSRRAIILSDEPSVGEESPCSIHRSEQSVEQDTSSESERESTNETEVQSVRRRIKGVLPASWLRFDQKQQHGKHVTKPANHVSSMEAPRLGVARHIKRSRGSLSLSTDAGQVPFMIPEDSDSDGEISERAVVGDDNYDVISAGAEVLAMVQDADSDSMQEEHIDRMLPTKSRGFQSSRSRRQDNRTRYGFFKHSSDQERHHVQQKISKHLNLSKGPRKQSQRSTKLGLVDVTGSPSMPQPPNFIRVALRTANQRRDKGRHTPVHKVLKMPTREQTAEVDETVRQWRNGNLVPNSSSIPRLQTTARVRSPLVPLSGNGRRLGSGASTKSTTIARSSKAGPRQLPLDQVFLRRPQGSFSNASRSREAIDAASRPQRKRKERGVMTSRLFSEDNTLPAVLEAPRRAPSTGTKTAPMVATRSELTSAAANENPILERFLDHRLQDMEIAQETLGRSEQHSEAPRLPRPLVRKRAPCRLQPSFQMPTVPHLCEEFVSTGPVIVEEIQENEMTPLSGFEPFDVEYTMDFDIEPLPSDFSFNASTFIGRGRLQEMIDSQMDDCLLTSRTAVCVHLPNSDTWWGPWNETVSSDLNDMEAWICAQLEDFQTWNLRSSQVTDCMNSVLAYLTKGLSFLDAVDRRSCVDHFTSFINRIREALSSNGTSLYGSSTEHDSTVARLPIITTLLLMSHQVRSLAGDKIVEESLRQGSYWNLFSMATLAIKTILDTGISDLVQFQQCVANRSVELSSEVARQKAESLVVLLHVANQWSYAGLDFWALVADTTPFKLDLMVRNIGILERKWFSLFVLLPFFDVEPNGMIRSSSHTTRLRDNWGYVKKLLEPILDTQSGSAHVHGYNEYCRSLFKRCHILATKWGWIRCQPILRVLYDFFAKNNLRNLDHEIPRGHPTFLQHPCPTMPILCRTDTAYVSFLKLVGSAVPQLCHILPERSMRSIIFRLTPNHGRSLPKDEALRQEDLEALRNHHNLLSLLYMVSPSTCRPSLNLLRDLIRVEDSHRQACHISIRTWTDITIFNLSEREVTPDLKPLVDWFNDILGQLVQQHIYARKEVEQHYHELAHDIRENTIATNQRQIEAILKDALESLGRAISQAPTSETLTLLLVSALESVFNIFDANVGRINSVLKQGLAVVQTFVSQAEKIYTAKDSQEYGDWSVFEDVVPEPKSEARVEMPEFLAKSLRLLLSNALTANRITDERFMAEILRTWSCVAHFQVGEGARSWADFVDLHGRDSWYGFSDTDQKTRYTPLFFAMVIDKDPLAYDNHKLPFLRSWITSLADRESQLRFQGRLTSAILNRDPSNPLLQNPPFARGASGLFEVTAVDIAERRLTLIASILSNMWESQQFSLAHNLPETVAQKRDYSDLLKTFMRSMKDNFKALGNGPSSRGAYVEFVQSVITLMQQYTKDFCPIDRYFVDSSQFPLPVHDPNYVVGRLKGYALRLNETQVCKQLVTFLLSTVERAVTDGKQEYLTDQLTRSMTNSPRANATLMTLQSFFARAIVPAYTATALSDPCGWLLAAPLLDATARVFRHTLSDVNGTDRASVSAAVSSMTHALLAIQRSTGLLVDHPGHLELTHVVRILRLYYAVVCAALGPLDYCVRAQPSTAGPVLAMANFFRGFAAYAFSHMDGNPDAPAPPDDLPEKEPCELDAITDYAAAGVKTALGSRWVRSGEAYEMRGSTGVRAMRTDLGSFEEEYGALVAQLLAFCRALGSLSTFARHGDLQGGRWNGEVLVF